MLTTFFSEFTTQSKTAFSFGTRFMVFKGRSTRNTRNDFIVDNFWDAELFDPSELKLIIYNKHTSI